MSTITATVTTIITTIPLLRHRDTVVNFPADQDDFVAKYEATNDHLSVSTVPQINAVGDQIDIITGQINIVAGEVNTNAGIATTQAGEALASANAAALSETNANNAKLAAEAALDSFDDRYLGAKAVEPTLDNDGNPLLSGALYYNTVSDMMKVYDLALTTWMSLSFIPTDHGSLTGLADDDHLQYHNDTRGDARYLKLVGGNLTGALNESRATVASHATTADIWGALGNQIDFTGTATVTAFPNAPQAGAERTLICAGACSFTAGANMVIDGVPSGTVTCATNDKIIVRAISTTTFNITRFKADGTAQVSAAGGSMIFLSEVTTAGAATVDLETTIDSTYDNYIITANNIVPSTDNSGLRMLFKVGGVYLTATYLGHGSQNLSSSDVYTGSLSNNVAFLALAVNMGNAAGESGNFTININSPSSTTLVKNVSWIGGHSNALGTNYKTVLGSGTNTDTGAITGIRFLFSAGNISGTFRLYGIKKA